MLSEKIEYNDINLKEVHWTNEANFHLSGHVNKQNMRIYAREHPNEYIDKPISHKKVLVWCAVTPKKIIGPYFFEDERGSSIIVNGVRYLNMMKKWYIPAVRRCGMLDTMIFQQDGAPCHAGNVVIEWL